MIEITKEHRQFMIGLLQRSWAKPPNYGTEQIDRYLRDIADIPVNILNLAADEFQVHSVWFPTSGQLRNIAVSLLMEQSGIVSWYEAWAIIINVRQAYFGLPIHLQKEFDFTDPFLNHIKNLIGWHELMKNDSDYFMNRFKNIYESERNRMHSLLKRPASVKAMLKPGTLVNLLEGPK